MYARYIIVHSWLPLPFKNIAAGIQSQKAADAYRPRIDPLWNVSPFIRNLSAASSPNWTFPVFS